MFDFPNVNGSLLTIDDSTVDRHNPSCLSSLSNTGTTLQYVGNGSAIRSSLLIRAGSLQSNRTYQFMVQMQNLHNALSRSTGYVLVRVQDAAVSMVVIG